MAKKNVYDNESISSLKGADRVRKRPGVIFGSDGLEGCEHAVFEILSNAIDEARGGHGKLITVTRFLDRSVQVEDMGRGCPVDWNEKEGRYNWELVFCELYAGGKYDNENSENYEFSLGLNGLGSCASRKIQNREIRETCRKHRETVKWMDRGRAKGKIFPTIHGRGRKKSAAEMGSRWNRRRKKTDLQEVMMQLVGTRRQKSLRILIYHSLRNRQPPRLSPSFRQSRKLSARGKATVSGRRQKLKKSRFPVCRGCFIRLKKHMLSPM